MLIQILVEFFLLFGLIRLLLVIEKPFVCSSIYGIAMIIKGIIFALPVFFVAFDTAVSLSLTVIYFYTLSRFDCTSIAWWFIALTGLFLLLISSFYWIPNWYDFISNPTQGIGE